MEREKERMWTEPVTDRERRGMMKDAQVRRKECAPKTYHVIIMISSWTIFLTKERRTATKEQ